MSFYQQFIILSILSMYFVFSGAKYNPCSSFCINMSYSLYVTVSDKRRNHKTDRRMTFTTDKILLSVPIEVLILNNVLCKISRTIPLNSEMFPLI